MPGSRLRRVARTTITATVLSLVSLAPASAETLADALISAYRHSHLLDQNRAVLRAADEDVAQAVAALRPVLAFTGTVALSPTNSSLSNPLTTSLDLTASITIFDNGATRLGIEAAKESVLATREALVNVEQQVLLAAVQAYLDVLSANSFVALRQSNVRLITQELRAARDRFEVGEVTRTDVALAESRLAAARSQLAAEEGGLAVAREAYRVAVGRYPGRLSPLPRAPRVPASQREAEGVAVRTHPLIRQAQRQVSIAEINIKRAETAMKFTVTGRASVGVTHSSTPLGTGWDDSASASVTLNQPIYSGGALASALRQSKAGRDQARHGLLDITHNIQQGVGNAWATLGIAQAQIQAADRQIRAAQIAFDGTREEASLGARTTLDVLDAEQELLDARASRIDAEAQAYVAIYSLLSAMGLLTVDHLQLGIQTYDPATYYDAVKNAPAQRSRQGKQLDSLLERLGRD